MKICIICSDEHIQTVRQRAKQIEAFAKNHVALVIPLSADGEMPQTHWFCYLNATPEMLQQIKELQEFSEVVESDPHEFLTSRNLKTISVKKRVAARRTRKDEE